MTNHANEIKVPLIFRSAIIGSASLIQYYTMSVVSVILPYYMEYLYEISIDSDDYSYFSSIINTLFNCMVLMGIIIGGTLFYEFPRKLLWLGVDIAFVFLTLFYQIPVFWLFIATRTLLGLLCGMYYVMAMMDLSEIFTKHIASKVLNFVPLGTMIGQLCATAMGMVVVHFDHGWRIALAFPIIFVLPRLFFYKFFFQFENPRFLYFVKPNVDQCKRSLKKLYGNKTGDEVLKEFEEEFALRGKESTLKQLWRKTSAHHRIGVGVCIGASIHLIGTGSMANRITEIYIISLSNYYTYNYLDETVSALVLVGGVAGLVGIVAAGYIFSFNERKPVLVKCLFAISIIFLYLAISFTYFSANWSINVLIIYNFMVGLAPNSGFYLLMSEILPKKSFILAGFISQSIFLFLILMQDLFGLNTMLYVFTVNSFLVGLFISKFYVETYQKNSLEIMKEYKDI